MILTIPCAVSHRQHPSGFGVDCDEHAVVGIVLRKQALCFLLQRAIDSVLDSEVSLYIDAGDPNRFGELTRRDGVADDRRNARFADIEVIGFLGADQAHCGGPH